MNAFKINSIPLPELKSEQGVQPGPLRGPVGALPRNPMVQCGFEKIAGLGVDWNFQSLAHGPTDMTLVNFLLLNLEYDMSTL
jgi:hypothetical protein